MSGLRDELRAREWLRHPAVLLADDWTPPLRHFAPLRRVRAALSVRHDPGRVTRHYLFARPEHTALALELRLTLCLDGWTDTVDVVFRTLESHQGHLPRPITETPRDLSLGHLGFAWRYREAPSLDALVFARCNLVVFLRRYSATIEVVDYARQLDRELHALGTCDSYAPTVTGAFDDLGRERPVRVIVGERLDLGTEPDHEQWFYAASAGSVNRDPVAARRRYFRAPSTPTQARLWAYAVGLGMLARRESLEVEVKT
jgi:hypothetical protein